MRNKSLTGTSLTTEDQVLTGTPLTTEDEEQVFNRNPTNNRGRGTSLEQEPH